MNDYAKSPESDRQLRSYSEVLADLADSLEPEALRDLQYDLGGMALSDRSNATFEALGGSEEYPVGKAAVPIGDSNFTLSYLLDVEWESPLPCGRGVFIQASADLSGNRHPRLLVIDFPKGLGKPDGKLRSPADDEVVSWLEQFLSDLRAVQELVNQHWYTPRPSTEPWPLFRCIDGIWQEVDKKTEEPI